MPKKKTEKKALPQMVRLSRRDDPKPMSVYRSALYQPKGIIEDPMDGERGHVYHEDRDHSVIFVSKDAVWVRDPDLPVIRRSSRHAHHRVPAFTGLFSQSLRRGS